MISGTLCLMVIPAAIQTFLNANCYISSDFELTEVMEDYLLGAIALQYERNNLNLSPY